MSQFTDALRDLMTETITIAPRTGQDSYGRPTYGGPVSYAARISGRPKLVRTARGAEAVASVTVYLADAPTVGVEDRVTLPSPYTPTQPVLLAVQRSPDEDGVAAVTLYLG